MKKSMPKENVVLAAHDFLNLNVSLGVQNKKRFLKPHSAKKNSKFFMYDINHVLVFSDIKQSWFAFHAINIILYFTYFLYYFWIKNWYLQIITCCTTNSAITANIIHRGWSHTENATLKMLGRTHITPSNNIHGTTILVKSLQNTLLMINTRKCNNLYIIITLNNSNKFVKKTCIKHYQISYKRRK